LINWLIKMWFLPGNVAKIALREGRFINIYDGLGRRDENNESP
jgi:hypothetical protein